MEGQYLKPPDSRSHFCARPLHFHVTYSLFWPLYCCSVAKLRLTLCDPVNCSTPGFPVVHYLPELTQTHVHWVGDAIQPTHPLAIPLSSYLQPFPASRSFPALLLLSHFSHVWPHPWDSPGKNTGVGCHFLLQCIKVKSESEVAQSCLTLRHPMDYSLPGSSVHGIFQARGLEWGAIAYRSLLQLPGHVALIRCGPIRAFSLGWQSVCLLSLLSKGRRGKAIWINCWSPWCFSRGQNRSWCHNNLHLSFQCQPSWHPHNTCFSIRSPLAL